MNVTIEKLPPSRLRLRVELPPDEVQPFLKETARELSRTKTPKGFRPGAAPLEVMRSMVGDAQLVEQTLKRLVSRTFVSVLLEHPDIEAVGAPEVHVESAVMNKPWSYRATIDVLPSVTLGDYRRVHGHRRLVPADPAEVDRELEQLRKLRASYLTVPRGARLGDRVEVDVETAVENVPLEGATPRREILLLGDGSIVPGFEEQLTGMRGGETKTFSIRFPENHHRTDLRGRTGNFRVVMHTVQQPLLPELNDHFAQGIGKFTSLADLRGKLAAHIEEEREIRDREHFQQELLGQVTTQTTYGPFPDTLVENELDTMMVELREGVEAMGMPFDTYLSQVKKTRQELRDGLQAQALARVRAALALRAIAKAERIVPTEQEVDNEVNEIVKRFADRDQAAKRLDVERLREMAGAAVRNRKVFTVLEDFADRNRGDTVSR